MATATDVTSEHYQMAEVKETILRCCHEGDAWRCLNGDTAWYWHHRDDYGHRVRLSNPDDYDTTTAVYRTLYWSLDLFEPEVKGLEVNWVSTSDEEDWRGKPEVPLGTLRECRAYSLGVDIDAVSHNAFEDPATTKALEDAATFFISKLREAGITKSVHALCSGGGVYVLLHHALFTTPPDWN